MAATDHPIGYWLKHLDNLIDAQFGATLADLGVRRREWQVLNDLRDGPRTRAEVTDALAPFWRPDAPTRDAVLAGLAHRGWISGTDPLALTGDGGAAHARIAARVRGTRAGLMTGLTTEQYVATVEVLATMSRNAETALTG